jgi:small subunit ribosomal protein S8
MVFTDSIADMLTRIRNAVANRAENVSVPMSVEKKTIADILQSEGYISGVEVKDEETGKSLVLTLKYGPNGEKIINGLKRISKPGLRVYAEADKLPKVINGLGIAIISTNKGIVTDKQARTLHVGGEVLAYVW